MNKSIIDGHIKRVPTSGKTMIVANGIAGISCWEWVISDTYLVETTDYNIDNEKKYSLELKTSFLYSLVMSFLRTVAIIFYMPTFLFGFSPNVKRLNKRVYKKWRSSMETINLREFELSLNVEKHILLIKTHFILNISLDNSHNDTN